MTEPGGEAASGRGEAAEAADGAGGAAARAVAASSQQTSRRQVGRQAGG